MLCRRRGPIICAAAAVVVVGTFQRVFAGISFDSTSRISLTHDAGNSTDSFSTGLISVPRSNNIYPANPLYQIDNPFSSGSAETRAVGSLGHVTNATTASFVLATGTGVTQTDPGNLVYPNPSTMTFNVDLNWNVTTGGFGPLANGFASLNTGVVVGAGGTAELHINLDFLNQNGTPLRSTWKVDKTWTTGTYNEPFSTSRVLGGGILAQNSKLHIVGTIVFKANNEESPSRFDALRAEFGGTPPTGVYKTDAQGSYFDRNWEQATFDPSEPGLLPLPNGIGDRAWFAGTTAVQGHTVSITDNIKLGTLDISSPTPYNFTGSAPVTWSTNQGDAVLNVRGAGGNHSFTNPFVLAAQLDAIVEGSSALALSGPISGAQGITKFGAGTLLLNAANNSYSGPTVVSEGKLQFIGVGATAITLNSGTGLDASGIIRNFVTARSGSHIAPGINGIGDISFEGLTLDPGSTIDIEGAGSSFDGVYLLGNNTHTFKDGKFNLIQRSTLEPGTYPIIRYNGEAIGDLTGQLSLVERRQGNLWATLFDSAATTTIMLNLSQIPQWNVDAGGSWGSAANWSPPIVPVGPSGIAGFLGKITAARTVTLDGPRTVGAIIFDNANRYTLAAGSGGGLTVGDSANPGTIEVATGNHLISAPLTLSGSTEIKVAGGQALTLSGQFHISNNQTLTKSGDGTLTISGAQIHGTSSFFNIDGGTVMLNSNPGTTALAPLALSINGSKVVLGANADLAALNVNVGGAGTQTLDLNSPATAGAFRTVRVYSGNLNAAKAALWDAIVNANQAGAADPLDGIVDTNLHANSRIGIALLPTQLVIRPTRIGDVNMDGLVSISDFIDLASHFNQIGTATWQEGDLNYDRSVTISDFIDLASNFNSSYAGDSWPISGADAAMLADFAEAHGVPEPGMAVAVLAALGCMGSRRRRSYVGLQM